MGRIPRKNEKCRYTDEYFLDLFAASYGRDLTDVEVAICKKYGKEKILRFDLHRKVENLFRKTGIHYHTGSSRPGGIEIKNHAELKLAENDTKTE